MTAAAAISTSDTDALENLYQQQKAFFDTGVTKPYAFRKGQLQVLKSAIKRHEERILAALKKDLNKSPFEAFGTEVGLVYEEINHAARHLKQWMQPERVATPLMFFPSTSKVYKDALGITLIIAPWNYPFMLLMAPLVSAIAGGNTCILKPSEMATATEAAIFEMINETFEEEYIAVINGPGEKLDANFISKYPFGRLFFTGSTINGKKVLTAAASQLTPVTLELGGKTPCVVAADANLDFTAKKIAWGKWINAGQTCVSPDYLLVHESIKEKFLQKLAAEFERMMGVHPDQNEEYPRIINKTKFRTLESLLDDGKVLFGGKRDEEKLFFAPTVIAYDSLHTKSMQEEIFGPILPIFTFSDYPQALDMIGHWPNPLAFYLFTENKKLAAFFIDKLSFGGGCINNTLIHLGVPTLPFGGIGTSGMGTYHGKDGFETFTRKKAVVSTPAWFDVKYWYPPFRNHLGFLRWFMK